MKDIKTRKKAMKKKLGKLRLSTIERKIRKKGINGYAKELGTLESILIDYLKRRKREGVIARIVAFLNLALLPVYFYFIYGLLTGEKVAFFQFYNFIICSYILFILSWQRTVYLQYGKVGKVMYRTTSVLLIIILMALTIFYLSEEEIGTELGGIILVLSIINYLAVEIGLRGYQPYEMEKPYQAKQFPVIGVKAYLKALKWISLPLLLSTSITGATFLISHYENLIVNHVTFFGVYLGISILFKERVERIKKRKI